MPGEIARIVSVHVKSANKVGDLSENERNFIDSYTDSVYNKIR
jgi:hypothetical protein